MNTSRSHGVHGFVRSSSCMVRFQNSLGLLLRRVHRFVYGKQRVDTVKPSFHENFSKQTGTAVHVTTSPKADCKNISFVPISEQDEFRCQLLDLPEQVRELIYSLVSANDILSLRLTCSDLKTDVELLRGVVFRLHDGRLDYEKSLETLGIEKLLVEQFLEEKVSGSPRFLYPHLLKTVEVNGPIRTENFESILETFSNLTRLTLAFQYPDHNIQSPKLNSISLSNLKVLDISSNSFRTTESHLVASSIKGILCSIQCPKLVYFVFGVVGLTRARLQEYHVWAQTLLSRTSRSLKRVEIQLKQLMHPFIVVDLEIEVINEWTATLNLEELKLHANSHGHLWHPLLDSQRFLRELNLDVKNLSWNRLILVLDKSAKTLKIVRVTGLCLTINDGIRVTPVDLGLLRNLENLEILEIQHQDMETRGMNSPEVLRTSLLPRSLRSIKLCNLLLKPHQSMFLAMKLPFLEVLHLESWTDSLDVLAAFLTVLTFLLKFDLTPVKAITIIDTRRRMENGMEEIERMKNNLCNTTDIYQDNSELYSRLVIKRLF